jgi:peptidoglycan/xylan/chitin deacetylase (PgdA/CDA1 family)
MSSSTDNDERLRLLKPLEFCSKILTFHKMLSGFTWGSTNYAPRRFERLLDFLVNSGYELLNARELLERRADKGVALTFDDGYEHLRKHLPPLIDRYRLVPTIFLPTGYIGRPNRWDYSHLFVNTPHLDKNGIRDLVEQGAVIGSHGHRHTDLTLLKDRQLAEELNSSKKTLEDITGQEVTAISYPFGRCNERVIHATAEAGYTDGFTMTFPDEDNHRLAIGRYAVYGYDSFQAIMRKINRGPLYGLEKIKARITNGLGMGTVLLNRLRRME